MTDTNFQVVSLQDFIENGFFPKELVPAFTTKHLANHLNIIKPIVESNKISSSQYGLYSFPKATHNRRNLGIVNPLHQIILCQKLSDHWQELYKSISDSPFSNIFPLDYTKRAISRPISNRMQLLSQRAISSAGFRYGLYVDISRYYSTIYTHSISWALHGKVQVKNNLRIPNRKNRLKFLGDIVDECVRNTQDKQSIGIPIGTDSSFVIAEIIGSAMDRELYNYLNTRKIKFEGFRYIDDYYLYFNSLSDAEYALSHLNGIFKEFELEGNSDKALIVNLPESLEAIWVSEIRHYPFNQYEYDPDKQCEDILTFFSRVFEYSKNFPIDSVIKYSLVRIREIIIKRKNWNLYEAFLLQSIVADPSSLPVVTSIFTKYLRLGYSLNNHKIADTLNSIILYHCQFGHSHEISWALWLCKTLKLSIHEDVAKAVSNLDDPVVALIALDLYSNDKLIDKGLNYEVWENLLTQENLYSRNWLFSYEAHIKDYFPKHSKSKYIDNDFFFSCLKNNNISFYDKISFEDYEDTQDFDIFSDDDNDDDNNIFGFSNFY